MLVTQPSEHKPRPVNRRLLPQIIEERARVNPDAVWAEYPQSSFNYAEGFTTITYPQLVRAIDNLAWYLHKNVEKTREFRTLAYMAPNDARYAIILYACIKTGFKVLFASPRNSQAAHENLLKSLNCTTMVTIDPVPASVGALLSTYPMDMVVLPSLEELLECENNPFPYVKTYDEASQDPYMVLHTSGSTGLPKPLIYTQEFAFRCANASQLPASPGTRSLNQLTAENRMVCLLPLFHIAGIYNLSMMSIYNNNTIILPSPSAPPTYETLATILKYTSADWAAVVPSIIEGLGRDIAVLEFVSQSLSRLCCLGGNPPPREGSIVAEKLRFHSSIGSSEWADIPQLIPADDDDAKNLWAYIRFNPESNIVLEEYAPGLYELIMKRDTSRKDCQPGFLHFPDAQEFRTRDLFSPHPKQCGYWLHEGRCDDIIVFSNGEKANPVSFEAHLAGHPDVTGAIMFGTGRFEAGVLVEMKSACRVTWTAQEKAKRLDQIWPYVREANAKAPAYARVAKTHICFTSPSKPIMRTGKGTIQRQLTLRSYAMELDSLYRDVERMQTSLKGSYDQIIDLQSPSSIARAIRSALKAIAKLPSSDNDDFFIMNVDSLEVLRLARHLQMVTTMNALEPSLIYHYPSVNKLTAAIAELALQETSQSSLEGDRKSRLQEIENQYFERIDQIMTSSPVTPPARASADERLIILLTGSTGAIGSYILNELLIHPASPHIICLNRSVDARSVQISRNADRDPSLLVEMPAERVTFLQADYASDCLGLDQERYSYLKKSVSLVIHNAWPVNFNLALSGFTSALDGVLNLLKLCMHSERSPPLFFLSSVSAAMGSLSQTVPENALNDLNAPLPGYGESKYIAERILYRAALNLRSTIGIARIGQIAGSADSDGGWNERDWLPSLLLSSRYLKAIPASLGVANQVDWIPIDRLGHIIIELGLGLETNRQRSGSCCQTFNIINPSQCSWQDLLPSTLEALQISSKDDEITIVSFPEWIKRLRNSSIITQENGHIDKTNPAVKLIEFYERHGGSDGSEAFDRTWNMEEAQAASQSLKTMEAIRPQLMQKWVRRLLKQYPLPTCTPA